MNLLTIITILGIVIVLAFLLFIFFDIRNLIKNKTNVEKEDIESNICPDFFVSSGDKCVNKYKLGDGLDFDPNSEDKKYSHPLDGNENKCLWARNNKVPWDGIDRLC